MDFFVQGGEPSEEERKVGLPVATLDDVTGSDQIRRERAEEWKGKRSRIGYRDASDWQTAGEAGGLGWAADAGA